MLDVDAVDFELADVLVGDGGVRGDVDDVDPLVALGSQMVDGLCDDAAGDECFSEADFVGDEEAWGGVWGGEQPLEGVSCGSKAGITSWRMFRS